MFKYRWWEKNDKIPETAIKAPLIIYIIIPWGFGRQTNLFAFINNLRRRRCDGPREIQFRSSLLGYNKLYDRPSDRATTSSFFSFFFFTLAIRRAYQTALYIILYIQGLYSKDFFLLPKIPKSFSSNKKKKKTIKSIIIARTFLRFPQILKQYEIRISARVTWQMGEYLYVTWSRVKYYRTTKF